MPSKFLTTLLFKVQMAICVPPYVQESGWKKQTCVVCPDSGPHFCGPGNAMGSSVCMRIWGRELLRLSGIWLGGGIVSDMAVKTVKFGVWGWRELDIFSVHVAALKLAPWERRRKTRWATGIICVGLWYFVVDIDLWLLPSLSDVEGMGASLKYKPTIYHCPQKGGGGHAKVAGRWLRPQQWLCLYQIACLGKSEVSTYGFLCGARKNPSLTEVKLG